MYSPSLAQLLVKAQVEELHRRTNRQCIHAPRAREIHPQRAASLTAYLKRVIPHRGARAAHGATAASSQSS